jgi:hypothetical protein
MLAVVFVPVGNSRSQLLGISCAPAVVAAASNTTSEKVGLRTVNVLSGQGEAEWTTTLEAKWTTKLEAERLRQEASLSVPEFG